MIEPATHTLDVPGARLTYDVHQPEEPGALRPLFVFGSPMGASGFEQLVSHFGDRILITYDPRGMNRSTRSPGSELTAETHAEDYHRVIAAEGLAAVDAFGSSGGGMCALHWIVAHTQDVHTLVSHEPPLVTLLEDREIAIRVFADIVETYQRAGYGPAMAKFIQLVMRTARCPTTTSTSLHPTPRSSDSRRRTTARATTCCSAETSRCPRSSPMRRRCASRQCGSFPQSARPE